MFIHYKMKRKRCEKNVIVADKLELVGVLIYYLEILI